MRFLIIVVERKFIKQQEKFLKRLFFVSYTDNTNAEDAKRPLWTQTWNLMPNTGEFVGKNIFLNRSKFIQKKINKMYSFIQISPKISCCYQNGFCFIRYKPLLSKTSANHDDVKETQQILRLQRDSRVNSTISHLNLPFQLSTNFRNRSLRCYSSVISNICIWSYCC